MKETGYARSFQELTVYRKARQVADSIYGLSREFPKEEVYSLTDQIRRSSRSIGAQIAEAWGKRRYERHFISKLTDADAEQMETQHWVSIALSCDYLTSEQAQELLDQLRVIGRMLHAMIEKAGQFCNAHASIREEEAYYSSGDESEFL